MLNNFNVHIFKKLLLSLLFLLSFCPFISETIIGGLFPFVERLHVGEESRYDAEEGQESAYMEYKLYACLLGEPSEESGTDTSEAKRQSEEESGNRAYMRRF